MASIWYFIYYGKSYYRLSAELKCTVLSCAVYTAFTWDYNNEYTNKTTTDIGY